MSSYGKEAEGEKGYAIWVGVDHFPLRKISDFIEQMLETYDFLEYYATGRTLHRVEGGRNLITLDEEDLGRIHIRKIEDVGAIHSLDRGGMFGVLRDEGMHL